MPRRLICWPNFDRVCAKGGCIHCRDGERKTEAEILAGRSASINNGEPVTEDDVRDGMQMRGN